MKVLLVNHGTAAEWGGGDGVQIRETAKRLRQRGYSVEVQNKDIPDVKGFDIVHIFNCRVANSFISQIKTCKKAGIPVVVSPIWINIGRALWGSRGTYAVLKKAVKEGMNELMDELKLLRERKLIVSLDGGEINSTGMGSYNLTWIQQIAEHLRMADGLLPNSWLELKSVQTDLNWSGSNYEIANYGVDAKIFLDADPQKFREYSGINEPFIMQAGRIEAAKNQAMLCWALRNTNVRIVLVGSKRHWPEYAALCKEIGGDRVTIIDHLEQSLLASAYAGSRVHCLPSWMDTCGLVSLEAALSGTAIVGSTFGHELEYLKNDAWLADPGDEKSVRNAVERAWDSGPYKERQLNLKRRILSKYNWETNADSTERIYIKILENK